MIADSSPVDGFKGSLDVVGVKLAPLIDPRRAHVPRRFLRAERFQVRLGYLAKGLPVSRHRFQMLFAPHSAD